MPSSVIILSAPGPPVLECQSSGRSWAPSETITTFMHEETEDQRGYPARLKPHSKLEAALVLNSVSELPLDRSVEEEGH